MNIKSVLSHIFPRIFVSTLCVSALVIIIFSYGTFVLLDRMYTRDLERTLSSSAGLISAAINKGADIAKIGAMCGDFAEKSGIRSTIVKDTGEVLFDSDADRRTMTNHLNRPEIIAAIKKGEKSVFSRFSQTMRIRMLYLAVPAGARASDGSYEYCVRLSVPLYDLSAAKKFFFYQILLLSGIAIALSGAVSFFIARAISSSVNSLRNGAMAFARGDFGATIEKSSVAELSELGSSMSDMARQLRERMEDLNKRNTELAEIFAHMEECVLICTRDGFVKRMNKSASETFGIPPFVDDTRPKYAEVLRNARLIDAVEKTFENGNVVGETIELSGGRVLALTGISLPYKSAAPRALLVLHDITHLNAIEKLRREFVAGVSHELKTPITAIKASAETLAEVDNDSDRARFIDMIEKESDRMNALVDDMLLLSKIESVDAIMRDNFSEVNLRSVIEEAYSMHENEAAKAEARVGISCPDDIYVNGDFSLLVMAVSNLLGNAVKYGGKGARIEIEGRRNGKFAEISVSDNGIGIAPEHLGRVFERFYRVDKGRSRNMGGTGLGLAIVKHVAMIHSGTASAVSEVGRGSTFTVSIRAEK